DLHAAKDGLVAVRVGRLERLNRIDPLEVFTVLAGQVVGRGELVASVKVAPHVVPERVVATAEAIVRTGLPLVRIRPFGGRRVAVVVKESVAGAARERFEASIRLRIEGLGAEVAAFRYIADEPEAATEALRELTRRGAGIDLVLTAGGASTDPADPFFVALDGLGGRLVRRGVPAHPGSMLWLGRVGRTAVLGLPTCGAYSKATAADLLIPRLLAGEPPTARTVARLAHGGVLTRDQRFRFPTYARTLEAPDG
ncbi:MAG: molybdopterin-binding protein, partial [Chloroflexota bacterium]